jgi:hypothetical protein
MELEAYSLFEYGFIAILWLKSSEDLKIISLVAPKWPQSVKLNSAGKIAKQKNYR